MNNERLEQTLQDFFETEVRAVMPPGEWWDRAISRLEERKSYSRWHSLIPKTRLAWVLLPLILLLIGGTVYGAGTLIHDKFFMPPGFVPPEGPGAYVIPTGKIYWNQLPDITSDFGKSVEIKITFINFDTESRVLRNFADFNFPARITIESRNLPFDDRVVRTFYVGDEQTELQPAESKEYLLTWDQRDESGQYVPYGWYDVRATVSSRRVTDTKTTQGSGGLYTRVLVLPPGGPMEKSFEIGQSQTVNGVTVTLGKMELSTQGAKVFTFVTSPDYGPENKSLLYGETDAEYKVDDKNWKPTRKDMFGTIGRMDGVRHIWDLDPVPQDAQELTLSIHKIADWEGPWEFKVPLQ
jgi:hypothetical protein